MRGRRRNLELAKVAASADILGQLLFVTLDEYQWTSSCERLMSRYQPGGILLSQANLRSPQKTCEMLSKIAGVLKHPPFLALEEEGGTLDPLRAFFPPLPPPHTVATKGQQAVKRMGSLIGEALALLGFNLNFAPRLDLANPSVEPSQQAQSFSADPAVVARSGEAFISGLRRHKVISCGKHFPGLGVVKEADAGVVPIVDKPMALLWREDLMPFRQSLSRLGLVKASYAAYKAYDSDLAVPATCSANVLEGLLRVKLGFRGIIVADYCETLGDTGPAFSARGVGPDFNVLAKSIVAGCDMLVVGGGGRPMELFAKAFRKAHEAGTLPARRVKEALKRIARAKMGLRLPTGKFSKKAFDRLCCEFEDFNQECHATERSIV
jgi:beta-N-acetylhexosaminidase